VPAHESGSPSPLIGIVGPCGAGKTTLAAGLGELGYRSRAIAQEHSYVPYMWKRITNPDYLIFLLASYSTCTMRRRLVWLEQDHAEQLRRLEDARAHADLSIETDAISAQEVLRRTLDFLEGVT
jgi:deoxyadenosine/deoxycytidine kinase